MKHEDVQLHVQGDMCKVQGERQEKDVRKSEVWRENFLVGGSYLLRERGETRLVFQKSWNRLRSVRIKTETGTG